MRTFQQDKTVKEHQLASGTMKRILGFAKPYRKQLIIFLIFIALGAAVSAINPLIYRAIIDKGIGEKDSALVIRLAILVATLAIISALLSVAERVFSARIGEGLIFDLRTEVFDHVQKMPIAFFARTKTGALVQRLNGDVLGAQQAFTSTLAGVVSNLLTVLFVLIAMFSMSWQLTLLSLVLLPAFIFPARWMGPRLAKLTKESYTLSGDAAQIMQERFNVSGAHLSKTYGRPEDESQTFADQADRVAKIGVKTAMYQSIFRLSLTTMAALAVAAVYGFGGLQAISGQISVGVVVALTAYLSQLYSPLIALSNVQVTVMTALVSFERVLEVLDLEPTIKDAANPTDLGQQVQAKGASLTFDHVTFRYPTAAEVSLASLESVALLQNDSAVDTLKDLTFDVPAGSMVALVGPSGAGKTTISHLITRMYDPTIGSVKIAGVDLTQASAQSIRDTVGVVTQDSHMFHDSIGANLRYARPEATDLEVEQALRRAHIWELISSLPSGLDTVIGDRGYRLSGGERQRLAIARLLLKSPQIVVLDEATAHLDSESEAAVGLALNEALKDRTAVVIAHRLSTIRDADIIIVVEDGQVREQGSHSELLAAGGLYTDLYRTQFADQEDGDPAVL